MGANVFTYIYYALVTRAVGVDAAGFFFSLVSAILVASLPAAIGGNVVAKMTADAQVARNAAAVGVMGATATAALVPVGMLVLTSTLLALPLVKQWLHSSDSLTIILASISLVFALVLFLQRAVFQGGGRFRDFIVSNLVEGGIKAVAGAATWLLHGGVRLALLGYVVATAAAFGFGARVLRGARPEFRFATPLLLHRMLAIALPVTALYAVTFADVILVQNKLDARSSGLYGSVALLGRALVTALQFIPTILLPRAAHDRKKGRSPVEALLAAAGLTVAAIACALVAAAFFAKPLVTIIAGGAFVDAAPLLFPYLIGMGALALASVLTSYLIGREQLTFGYPLIVLAAAEIFVIALYHPTPMAVVYVVAIGHCTLLVCCMIGLFLTRNATPTEARALEGSPG
jgi:O-antigen/teichoic acid export membrane protein